jgi:two-component system, NarL family, invasion response regulator UvrY
MIKVAVADDHKILREGVIKIINESSIATVVAEADSVAEVKRLLENRPEIEVLMCDISFRDGSGYEVLEYCKKYNKRVKVILLSIYDQSPYATKAIEGGAVGYLTKDSSKEELLSAIENAASGKKYLSQSIMSDLVDNLNNPKKSHDFFSKVLSRREMEVLELVVAGLDTNEIADKLFISEKTVANYRLSILEKCGVKNIVHLIKLYMDHT